jgi:hypothetical protein
MGKLCARGKAAAKRKYKVYPSAYANGYAVQVCKGTKPDGSGKKKTASGYKKGKKKATAKKRTTRKSTRRTTRRR